MVWGLRLMECKCLRRWTPSSYQLSPPTLSIHLLLSFSLWGFGLDIIFTKDAPVQKSRAGFELPGKLKMAVRHLQPSLRASFPSVAASLSPVDSLKPHSDGISLTSVPWVMSFNHRMLVVLTVNWHGIRTISKGGVNAFDVTYMTCVLNLPRAFRSPAPRSSACDYGRQFGVMWWGRRHAPFWTLDCVRRRPTVTFLEHRLVRLNLTKQQMVSFAPIAFVFENPQNDTLQWTIRRNICSLLECSRTLLQYSFKSALLSLYWLKYVVIRTSAHVLR